MYQFVRLHSYGYMCNIVVNLVTDEDNDQNKI